MESRKGSTPHCSIVSGLKVIHGYGSGSSKRGAIAREATRFMEKLLRAKATVSGRTDSTEAHI